MTQTARFEFRVRPEVKARIEAAAALAHESASDFAREAAVERADAILRRSEVTLVPPDFFDTLLDELDAPVQRNARLTTAARRAREVLREVPGA
jgi:uncharacterized protein (DUF1778 family)